MYDTEWHIFFGLKRKKNTFFSSGHKNTTTSFIYIICFQKICLPFQSQSIVEIHSSIIIVVHFVHRRHRRLRPSPLAMDNDDYRRRTNDVNKRSCCVFLYPEEKIVFSFSLQPKKYVPFCVIHILFLFKPSSSWGE